MTPKAQPDDGNECVRDKTLFSGVRGKQAKHCYNFPSTASISPSIIERILMKS